MLGSFGEIISSVFLRLAVNLARFLLKGQDVKTSISAPPPPPPSSSMAGWTEAELDQRRGPSFYSFPEEEISKQNDQKPYFFMLHRKWCESEYVQKKSSHFGKPPCLYFVPNGNRVFFHAL